MRSLESRNAFIESIERHAKQAEALTQSAQSVQRMLDSIERTEQLKRNLRSRADEFEAFARSIAERLAQAAALFERWMRKKKDRLAAEKIVNILVADKVDTQAAGAWISEHGSSISVGMLAAIIEGAMRQAMINTAERASRGRTVNAKTKERYALVLELWSEEPGITKIDLACEIADRCSHLAEEARARGDRHWNGWSWSVNNVRKWLQSKSLEDVRQICAMG